MPVPGPHSLPLAVAVLALGLLFAPAPGSAQGLPRGSHRAAVKDYKLPQVVRRRVAERYRLHAELQRQLAAPHLDELWLLRYLAERFPAVGQNLLRSAHVREGYSIQCHTLRVLSTYNRQDVHANLRGLTVPRGVRLEPTIRVALALHDIGKAIAVEERGNRDLQHHFTLPIVTRVMRDLGFKPAETRIARALINNNVLGRYVRGKLDAPGAAAKVNRLAASTGLLPSTFLALQSLFYTSDVAAYPAGRERVFSVQPGGRLELRSTSLEPLRAALNAGPSSGTGQVWRLGHFSAGRLPD